MLSAACGNKVPVSGDSSMERSLKVTEAIITGCLQPAGNAARDDHEQAATVAGNTVEEETQANKVPSRCTKYNLTD